MKDITPREQYLAYIFTSLGAGLATIYRLHWIFGIIYLTFFIVTYIHFYFKHLRN